MYYRLAEPYAFRGFEGLPYAVRAERGEHAGERAMFFGKGAFLDLLLCDGQHDVDLQALSEDGRKAYERLLGAEALVSGEDPLDPPESYQRYRIYPCRHIESVHWSITGRCNYNCRHCLVSAPGNHQPQPTLDECLATVAELRRCGVIKVDVTGGEPFVRRDWERVFRALSDAHIRIGQVFTNASMLDDHVLDVLEECGQRPAFQISFDGTGHHDWFRGVPDAEARAIAGFELLRRRGFRASAAMSLYRGNRDCLRETANLLAGLGASLLMVSTPQEFGVWREQARENALTFDETWEVYRAFIPQWYADGCPLDIHLEGYFSCRRESPRDYGMTFVHHAPEGADWARMHKCETVQRNLFLGPDGRVNPCMAFSDTAIAKGFPGIFGRTLPEALSDSHYRGVIDTTMADYLAAQPKCAACPHLNECGGGCLVECIDDDGNFLVPDERVCHFFRCVGEAAVREVADAAIQEYLPTETA